MTAEIMKMKITRTLLRTAASGYAPGTRFDFTHVSLGAGGPGGAGYEPTGYEIALKNEFLRVPVAGATQLGEFEYLVEALFEHEAAEGWVREIGVWAVPPGGGEPFLACLWSEAAAPAGYFSPGVPWAFAQTLAFFDLPGNMFNVVAGAPTVVNTFMKPFIDLTTVVASQLSREIAAASASQTAIINATRA